MKRKRSVFLALAVLFMLACSTSMFRSEMVEIKPAATQEVATGGNLVFNFEATKIEALATSEEYRTVGSWWVREKPNMKSKALAVSTDQNVEVILTVGTADDRWHYVSLIVDDVQVFGWIHSGSRGEK